VLYPISLTRTVLGMAPLRLASSSLRSYLVLYPMSLTRTVLGMASLRLASSSLKSPTSSLVFTNQLRARELALLVHTSLKNEKVSVILNSKNVKKVRYEQIERLTHRHV
jgi:hypothetical protein